jgi:HSP20 family protein
MNRRDLTLFDPTRIFSDNFLRAFGDDTPMSFSSSPMELEMYEDENNVVVRLKAPGYESENFDINIEDNVLTVSADIQEEVKDEDKKKKYYFSEIRHESFSKSVSLPLRVIPEKSEADYREGILTIKMPKSEDVKPKKVNVKAK